MQKHSPGPCIFKFLQFGFILNRIVKITADRENYGDETHEISKRHERRSLRKIVYVSKIATVL
jgi:hypothetical protein